MSSIDVFALRNTVYGRYTVISVLPVLSSWPLASREDRYQSDPGAG